MKRKIISSNRKRVLILFVSIILFMNNLSFGDNTEDKTSSLVKDDKYPKRLVVSESKIDTFAMQAISYMRKGEYEKSAYLLEKFILSGENIFNKIFYYDIHTFSQFNNELRKGVEYFDNEIVVNKEKCKLYYYRIIFKIMMFESKEYDKDNIAKIFACKINPSKIHYMLGISYLIQGKKTEYVKECDELKRLNTKLFNKLINLEKYWRDFDSQFN